VTEEPNVFIFQKTFDIIAILTVITICMILPIMFSRERRKITWWDYCYPYLGVPLWYLLREFGVGDSVNTSNFMVEMFSILMCSASAPWFRFALTYSKGRLVALISFILTLSPLAVAAGVRLIMPVLPS
jgi:hypothetical protein